MYMYVQEILGIGQHYQCMATIWVIAVSPPPSPLPPHNMYTAPPLTPQLLRASTIIPDDLTMGKPRAGTIAEYLMGGGDGGILSDSGRGDREKISGSMSPQHSPRIRSFTLTAPVHPKPE